MSVSTMLFLGLFFAIGFGIFGYGLYSWYSSEAVKAWPTTTGKIIACKLVESGDSDGTTYQAKVTYSYAVAGTVYQSDRVGFGYTGSSDYAEHRELADRLAAAQLVQVRYDPGNAARAALSYGLNRSTIFLLIFGATWLLFVSGLTALSLVSSFGNAKILSTIEIIR